MVSSDGSDGLGGGSGVQRGKSCGSDFFEAAKMRKWVACPCTRASPSAPSQLWVAMGQRSKQNHAEYFVLHSLRQYQSYNDYISEASRMFIVGQFNSWQVVILVAAVVTNDVLFPLFSSSDVGLRTRSGPNVRRFPQQDTQAR